MSEPLTRDLLYGQDEPEKALHTRILNDLHATLGAIVNLYGDMSRPPVGALTWPLEHVQELYPLMQQMAEQIGRAEAAHGDKDKTEYYRAIAGAMGLYHDATRVVRRLSERTKHQYLNAYAKAITRFSKGTLEPNLYMAAAEGDDKQLRRALMATCKATRKRFGDQLRQHAVTSDPPAIADQYVYQPEGEAA